MLAGNAGVSVGSGAGVTGLGADVAASVVAGTVATAPLGAGVCSPQASSVARIIRAVHKGIFRIQSFLSVQSGGTLKSVLLNVPVPAAGVQPASVSQTGIRVRKGPAYAGP